VELRQELTSVINKALVIAAVAPMEPVMNVGKAYGKSLKNWT